MIELTETVAEICNYLKLQSCNNNKNKHYKEKQSLWCWTYSRLDMEGDLQNDLAIFYKGFRALLCRLLEKKVGT